MCLRMLHVFDELCIDKVCPGEIRDVAYDSHGSPAMEKSVKTSGKARALVLTANGDQIGRASCRERVF